MDPDGENYKLEVMTCRAVSVDQDCEGSSITAMKDARFPNEYKMLVVQQAACNGDTAVATSNPRKIAVLYKLEGAGIYCNNS